MYSFPDLGPVCFSMSSSNCCFRFLRRQVRWSGIPISFRTFHCVLWSTQSKASVQFSSVQSLSHVWLFATSWITACQASLCLLPTPEVHPNSCPLSWWCGLTVVNKTEVDGFLELSAFSMIQQMLAIWSLFPLPFLNPAWKSRSSWFTYYWRLDWRILSITLLVCEMSAIMQ